MLANRSIPRIVSALFNVLLILSLLVGAVALPTSVDAASTIIVTTISDNVTNDTFCSLREAITNANSDLSTYADCLIAGSGNDTIRFDTALGTATISLGSALPNISDTDGLTIFGGSGITVRASVFPGFRLFFVNAGVPLTIERLTVSNGFDSTFGAGIYNQGILTLNNSAVSNNSIVAPMNSDAFGGGIYNSSTGILTLNNSTVSGNRVTAPASSFLLNGGGIFNSGTLTVRNSTFSDNLAGDDGGGIYNRGTLFLYNTIIANSASPGDCFNDSVGIVGGSNNNLIESVGACGLIHGVDGNIIGFDPNLGALTGSPAYFPLNSGSLAIDAGDDAVCAAAPVNNTSQNGVTRPQGAHCDIGAYEAQSAPSTPTNTPTSTPTDTPTNTPTDTPTDTPTETPTNTPTNTPTDTLTPSTFTLTVALAGTGSGVVTSNPAGINCGVDCSESYPFNTVVTLTAAPANGSTFTGWTSTVCVGTGTCTFTMNAEKSFTATFTSATATNTPTNTPTPTSTPTDTPTITPTPTDTPTSTPTDMPTNTSTPTPSTGTLRIVKEANPHDGTDFDFAVTGAGFTPIFTTKWGTFGSDNSQFNLPLGMTIDGAGNIYVADSENHRIQKFDSNGAFLLQWGTNGSGDGQFASPSGVVVDAAGNVFVPDSENNRIQKFDGNGTFLLKWGTFGAGDGQFKSPIGMAIDSSGNVYVADSNNYRIQKFNSNGAFLLKWGMLGSSDGQFSSPYGVAVDGTGNVYVADTGNHRIQKFDIDSNFLLKWGTNGSGDGLFDAPRDVDVDIAGNVYVADGNNHRIQKFDSSGSFLLKWGSNGSGNGQFSFPYGLTVDSAGNVYVADTFNSRIQKFAPVVNFALDDEPGQPNDSVDQNITFNNLAPGSYTISEQVASGWSLDSIQCFGGSPIQNGNSVSVSVAAGANVTCTFSNSLNTPTPTNTPTASQTPTETPTNMPTSTDTPTSTPTNTPSAGTITIIKNAFPPDGTDFQFTVVPTFLLKWGTNGSGNGQFIHPWGIALDSAGNVYVADTFNHRIQKFDSSGNFLLQWGNNGSGDGQFIQPRGVAVDGAGNVYVVDTVNRRIQKFDSSGAFLLKWGTSGFGNSQFNNPFGVAVDSAGNVYVSDTSNHRIQKFDSSGNFLLTWGTPGSGDGQFNNPSGVGVDDSTGNVYVVDTFNHRVQKFDSSGAFLIKWGTSGSGDGQFNQPLGVEVDSAGNVYVADQSNHRIQKFDSSGGFLLKWGTFGSGDGQFIGPQYVAMDSVGNIYVVEQSNNRVQKFRGTSVSSFSLDDAIPDDGDSIGSSQTFTAMLPGTYTVTEGAVAGWTLSDLTCLDSDSGGIPSTDSGTTATINLDPGETVTCTFTNSQPATDTPTPTPTNTPTSTPTDTPTPTETPTNTPTDTPTNTPTETLTNTPTETPTNTPTDTPTNTPTNTPTQTPTPTDRPTNTPTETPTNTPTNTPTATPTNTPADTTAPTVISSVRADTNPTNAASVNFTVTFSESVTGVDTADFTLTTTGVSGASISGVSGSGFIYTVTVSTGTGNGTIRLNGIDNDSIVDSASNPLGGAGAGNGNFSSGEVYTIDKTAPTVQSIRRANPNPTAAANVNFIVTFREGVNGVDVSDFSLTTSGVTGASVISVSGGSAIYTVTVNTGTGSGTIRLNLIDNDSIQDVAGNKLGGTGIGNGSFTTGQAYTINKKLTFTSGANQDGWILESGEDTNVGGTGASNGNTSATTIILGDNAQDRQYRGILHFNTAGLPDNAVIVSITLRLRRGSLVGTDPFITHQGLTVDIVKPYFGTSAGLQPIDFNAPANQSDAGTFSSTPVGGLHTASLGSSAYPFVNLTGTTQFRLRFQLDDNDDQSADYILFYSGNSIAANRPALVIEFYVP